LFVVEILMKIYVGHQWFKKAAQVVVLITVITTHMKILIYS